VSDPDRDATGSDQPLRQAGMATRTPIESARTCPNCGVPLADRACKLICPTPGCGYYLSCSDYY
jgi:hypothetical protein